MKTKTTFILGFLANLLFLNALLVALLWIMTEGAPPVLFVTVDSPKGAVVESVGGRRINLEGGGVQSYRIILPSDFTGTILPLKIEPADSEVRLISARLVSRFVFESVWPMNGPAAEIQQLDVSKATKTLSRKFVIFLGVGEMLLLFLSWGLVAVASRVRVLSRLEVIAVACALPFVLILVAPLQTIVANGGELEVSLGEILIALVSPFSVTLVLLGIGLLLTRRSAGPMFAALALGVVVYEYFELGFLSADFPVLDGEIYFFLNSTRGLWDAALLVGICAILLVVSWRYVVALPIVSFAVALLSLASVFDARKALPPPQQSELGLAFKPNGEILSDCYHSTNRNVAVYVLDTVSIPFATEVLRSDPELVSVLEGFVAYTNNVGMANGTVLGIAGLATGEYLKDPLQLTRYSQACFGSNSFVRVYADCGATVFFAPGSSKFGLSSVRGRGVRRCEDVRSPLRRRMKDQQQWNLFELSRFRLIPFIAKVYVYRMTISGWDTSRTEYDERWCYPRIASAPIRPDCSLSLQFWHTLGAHPPFDVNRDGVTDGVSREGDAAILEKTWFALRQFADQMKALKSRGLFDRSFIVLTSDHGIERLSGNTGGVPGRAHAILFVKPLGARGRLVYSAEPTSHAKIKSLLVAAATSNLNSSACTAILKTPVRVYSRENRGAITEYIVDASGRLIEERSGAAVAPAELPAIRLDHEYSLFANNVSDSPPVVFMGTGFFTVAAPHVIQVSPTTGVGRAEFLFRAPKSNAHYVVHLRIRTSGTEYSVGPDGFSLLMEDVRTEVKGGLRERTPGLRLVDFPVISDDRGIVSVALTCYDTVELRSIRITIDS